jgi:hypothetical protein
VTGDPKTPRSFEDPDLGRGPVEDPAMPYDGAGERAVGPSEEPEIEAVRRRHEKDLISIDGILGISVGRTPTGEDALVLYLRDPSVRSLVPSEIEGHPVQTIVTGTIDAYGTTE